MSIVTDIADAIAEELNNAPSGTFSRSFTALRKVVPAYELADLVKLKVSVVPKSSEISVNTRSVSQYEMRFDIGVQMKIASGASLENEVDSLGGFVDEIVDYLRQTKLAGEPNVAWAGTENDPIYVPEHLTEKRVFTSVLTLTYRAMR